MSKDSTFEVVIEQKLFNKGDQLVTRTEYYTDWAEADKAWCAYRELIGIKNSGIVSADLIEDRRRIHHKHVTKSKGSLGVFIEDGASISPPGGEQEIVLIDDVAVQS